MEVDMDHMEMNTPPQKPSTNGAASKPRPGKGENRGQANEPKQYVHS
jgi:hypothetical protein